jgi:DNA-binding Xre family transcriptional regulator
LCGYTPATAYDLAMTPRPLLLTLKRIVSHSRAANRHQALPGLPSGLKTISQSRRCAARVQRSGIAMKYDHREFMKALGFRIKGLRKQRAWTLRDMVVSHGYHQTAWHRIERGDGMTIPTLLKICDLFDMSVSQLLNGLADAPVDQSGVAKVIKRAKQKPKKKSAS